MTEHRSSRTLVKSAPELWAECSDAASLARHLGVSGEIRITRLEPETTVAWEGAAACGTVELAPAGWGTRVTLTASARDGAPMASAREQPASDATQPAAPGLLQPEGVARPQDEAAVEPTTAVPPPRTVGAARVDGELRRRPPAVAAEPVAAQRPRGLSRLLARLRGRATAAGAPAAAGQTAAGAPAAVGPTAVSPVDREHPVDHEPLVDPGLRPLAGHSAGPALMLDDGVLAAALDSLGRAHHRPYSRD